MANSNNSTSSVLPRRNRRQERQVKDLPTRVGRRLNGSKVDRYARYRNRVGRPLGPGVPGAKAGKHRVSRAA